MLRLYSGSTRGGLPSLEDTVEQSNKPDNSRFEAINKVVPFLTLMMGTINVLLTHWEKITALVKAMIG